MYNNSDLSIVVVSYDGYSDLWDDFFTLKNQNWANCPYPTYLEQPYGIYAEDLSRQKRLHK